MSVGSRPGPHILLGDEGAAAMCAASAEADPDSLSAASRLRSRFGPELAAAALAQTSLRRRAQAKFGAEAAQIWFTTDGLEQASRPEVAAWRAARLAAAGVRRVIDFGCGIGADARAFLAAGMTVTAVELDPQTAARAAATLPITASSWSTGFPSRSSSSARPRSRPSSTRTRRSRPRFPSGASADRK